MIYTDHEPTDPKRNFIFPIFAAPGRDRLLVDTMTSASEICFVKVKQWLTSVTPFGYSQICIEISTFGFNIRNKEMILPKKKKPL